MFSHLSAKPLQQGAHTGHHNGRFSPLHVLVMPFAVMIVIANNDRVFRWRPDKVEGVLYAGGEGRTFPDLPDPNLRKAAVGVHFLLAED